MVDLKTFLDLAMPNQSCLDATKQLNIMLDYAGFWGDIYFEAKNPKLYVC